MIRTSRATFPGSTPFFKIRFASLLLSSCFFAILISLQYHGSPGQIQGAAQGAPIQAIEDEPRSMALAASGYDDKAEVAASDSCASEAELDSLWQVDFAAEMRPQAPSSCVEVLFDPSLYLQRWDTLPQ
jgi:hypothetical protein